MSTQRSHLTRRPDQATAKDQTASLGKATATNSPSLGPDRRVFAGEGQRTRLSTEPRPRPEAFDGPQGQDTHKIPIRQRIREMEWNFGKVPVFPSEQANQSADLSPLAEVFLPSVVRGKLSIGAANDPVESEADAIADKVIRGQSAPAIQASSPAPLGRPSAPLESIGAQPVLRGVLDSPGQPLDDATRSFMEPRFGHDFSHVRIHTDTRAQESAREVNAMAYAVGNDVVFGAGHFKPGTPEGNRLMAHELVHVVQAPDHGPSILRRQTRTPEEPTVISTILLVVGSKTGSAPAFPDNEVMRRFMAKESSPEVIKACVIQLVGPPGVVGTTYRFTHPALGRIVDVVYGGATTNSLAFDENFYWLPPGGAAGNVGQGSAAPAGTRPTGTDPQGKPAAPQTKSAGAVSAKPATPAPEPTPPIAKSPDAMLAEFKALPDSIQELLRGGQDIKPEKLVQLLRIANKLKGLQPEDLALYKLLAKKLAGDLDAFEQSVDYFIQFKTQIAAQANAEKTKPDTTKEETLEEQLSKTWSPLDEKKFGEMESRQKEDLARSIAAEQRDIQLEHMVAHPGETAVGMAEGAVRLDKTAKAIAEDVKDAADGNKGAYTRIAGAVGAYNKYVAAAASIVFVALLFVPGVNLLELAAAGLAVAAASIALSVTESELRIKAAGEAKTPEDFKTETAKSAAAQANAVVAAALLALTLAMKIVARIPLPGRYQNVGLALKAAQTTLLEKSGIGSAWQAVKTDLLSKLRSSKQGLPEALAEQSKSISEAAKIVEGESGEEFIQKLAEGDPKLADLGISADQAKAIQGISGTPEGKGVPERLRQESLKALQDAPVEVGKKVEEFIGKVDESIEKLEKAQGEEQLKSAVDDAASRLSAEEQARQATKDEQAYLKERVGSAKRSGVREQAKKKLEALQIEKSQTQAEIVRLEEEFSKAQTKVNRLKKKALENPKDSNALAEFKAAKKELDDLRESDELGGFREERSKQNKSEEAILESLELKRPSLWQSTKDAIKKAAKRNSADRFLDANTGEVIEGEPVYGHIYGKEHRRLALEASAKGMTQEQFNKWVNEHPEWFQTETKANNESHRFEKPGVD